MGKREAGGVVCLMEIYFFFYFFLNYNKINKQKKTKKEIIKGKLVFLCSEGLNAQEKTNIRTVRVNFSK